MASMEPLLICCLMAHRSRKKGSPTVSWGAGRGRSEAEASHPASIPVLSLWRPPWNPSYPLPPTPPPLPASHLPFDPGAAQPSRPHTQGVSLDSQLRHRPRWAAAFILSPWQPFQVVVASFWPRLREGKQAAQGHPAGRWQSWTQRHAREGSRAEKSVFLTRPLFPE